MKRRYLSLIMIALAGIWFTGCGGSSSGGTGSGGNGRGGDAATLTRHVTAMKAISD